jgi:hypothetical protein
MFGEFGAPGTGAHRQGIGMEVVRDHAVARFRSIWGGGGVEEAPPSALAFQAGQIILGDIAGDIAAIEAGGVEALDPPGSPSGPRR